MTLDHLNSDDSAHMQHTSPKPSRTAHRQRQHKRPKLMQSSSELLPNQEADPSSSLGEFTPTNSITGRSKSFRRNQRRNAKRKLARALAGPRVPQGSQPSSGQDVSLLNTSIQS
ncbi:hypothetical protein K443DRAFT_678947 [Laccaria amethystina LaAM-08-1]|uniref:Uncharacterized protein n=1 Tax=Laccaria amethystina LaAM-08-1 TaxID=1095629 RepID=A0A0C9XSL9_9AGAR|nr:hypothetical protein K443DRAFT_678947 [Laccaria amethystina LaAM-08-1]